MKASAFLNLLMSYPICSTKNFLVSISCSFSITSCAFYLLNGGKEAFAVLGLYFTLGAG